MAKAKKTTGAAAFSRAAKQTRDTIAGTTYKRRGAFTSVTRPNGQTATVRTKKLNEVDFIQRNGPAIWRKGNNYVQPDSFIRDHAKSNGKKGADNPPRKALLSRQNGTPSVKIWHKDGSKSTVNLTESQYRYWRQNLAARGGSSKLMRISKG